MERLARVAFWMALIGPAAAVLHLVLRFGVNVPHWDEWELAGLLFKVVNGSGIPWSELVAQHNEHRIVFPRLVMLLIALLTRWNVVAELVTSVVLVSTSLILLTALAWPILRLAGSFGRVWAALTLSAMLFSLAQSENWLWGFQLSWFLTTLAAIASVALATWSLQSARPWAYVAGAVIAAIVGQYSIGSGIAIWPSIILILAFHPLRRWMVPAVLAAATAATAVYLVGYTHPPHHPSALVALEDPVTFLHYVGNFLSGPLAESAVAGFGAVGAFLALATVAASRHRTTPELYLPWLAIGAFAGANAVITGVGRVGFGAELGLASRYVTISLLLSAALVPLGLLSFRAWPAGRWPVARVMIGTSGATLLTALVAMSDVRAWTAFTARSAQMAEARHCVLLRENATDDCLGRVYPDPVLLRYRLKQLQAFGWSGFPHDPLQPPGTLRLTGGPDGTRLWRLRPEEGSVGWIGPARLDGDVLTVSGWARHPRGNLEATRRIVVVGDGTIIGEADVVGERPDVALFFRDPALTRSGWTLQAKGTPAMRELGPLQAYLVFSDDVLVALEGYARIEVAR